MVWLASSLIRLWLANGSLQAVQGASADDKYAFLNQFHPRRIIQPFIGDRDSYYMLIFPKQTSPRVFGVLKAELRRQGWSAPHGSTFMGLGDPQVFDPPKGSHDSILYFGMAGTAWPVATCLRPFYKHEGECEVDIHPAPRKSNKDTTELTDSLSKGCCLFIAVKSCSIS